MTDAPEPPFDLVEPSFYTTAGHHHELLRYLLATMPGSLIPVLKRVVFMTINRDALASSKGAAIVQRIRGAGLDLSAPVIHFAASPSRYEDLYKFNLTLMNGQNMVGVWWLHSQFYNRGPMISFLVFDPDASSQGSDVSLHQRVRGLKGPSNPYDGRPGQLRFDLAAPNRVLGLVHTADDPLSSAREFLIFRSLEDLCDALSIVGRLGSPDSLEKHRRDVDEQLDAIWQCHGEALSDLRVASALGRAKFRLLSLLREESDELEEARDSLAGLYTSMVAVRGGGLLEEYGQFRELLREENRILRRQPTLSSDLAKLLLSLSEFEEFSYELALRYEAVLLARHAFFDDWERLLIRSSMYFAADFPDAITSLDPTR